MIRSVLLSLLTALTLSGCSASEMTARIISEDQSRSDFKKRLDAANFARRSQGLPELDPCSEKFWYDRAWALSKEPCAGQVRRWEGGDTTALNPIGMVRVGFRRAVPESVQKIYDRRWQPQRDSIWIHRTP